MRKDFTNKYCIDRIRLMREEWYKENKSGDPVIHRLGKYDNVYDYDLNFPTDIGVLDRHIESFKEYVSMCKRHTDLQVIWLNGPFPHYIIAITLLVEGRKGIALLDKEYLPYYVDTLISGNLHRIDHITETYDPYGIYGEFSRLVYICWMPIISPKSFDESIMLELERLIYRIVIQIQDHIGRNGRTRETEAFSRREVSTSEKNRDTGLEQEIIKNIKEYKQEGKQPERNISSLVAKNCGASRGHVRKIGVKAKLFKSQKSIKK